MAIFRRHRASGRAFTSPFVLPSFFFSILPWIWSTPPGLAAGIGAHLVWLLACELLAPPAERSPVTPLAKTPPGAASPAAPHTPAFAPSPVLAVLDETSEIKTFRFSRPGGFEFSPGQFLAVRVQLDGRPHVRCYSISSAPHTRGYLEIAVRRQGLVSSVLHATLREGSTLTINRSGGQFVYPIGDDRPLALIAGGIGITPLLSMVRHAVAADPSRPITLLYSVRREDDLAFYDELRALAARHPQLHVVITLTRPAGPTRFRTGRIDAAMLRQHAPAPANTLFYVCGPGPMIADLRAVLVGLGVPENQVRFEQFDTAVAASLVNTAPSQRIESGEAARPAVRVTFEASGRSVMALPSHTLLETAEAEGVPIVSSCRAGVCQSCRTRLVAGAADCRSDVLDPEDRAAGFILACVSWPTGDCVLEA